jgi:hypothetical protein
MRLPTYLILVVVMFLIHACVWAEDSTAALTAAMSAEQKTISEKLTSLDSNLAEAQKKAAASNNSIESSEARDARNKYVQDVLQILAKPIEKWAGVVNAVTAGRHGGYTLQLSIPMSPGANGSTISISCETREEKIVNVMKGLKGGDIVTFSGKYEGSRALRSLNVRDFILEKVELVKSK